MKALTISQPFASMIASGEKFVENRVWETKYRGPIAIHAGKGTQYLTKRELQEFDHGGFVATAVLSACVSLQKLEVMAYAASVEETGLTSSQIRLHEHTEGPWCWILTEVVPVEFVAYKGAQGLWNVPSDLTLIPAA